MRGASWGLMLLVLALILAHLLLGSLELGWREVSRALMEGPGPGLEARVVWQVRIPRILTACGAGAGLALAGALMQTWFANPLAGPSVLGVSSGASLGVACMVLAGWGGGAAAWGGWPSALIAAAVGAGAVLGLLLLVSRRIAGPVTLLVFGLMLGYVVSATMSVLQAQADPNALQRFVLWGMGTFGATTLPVSLVLLTAALGLVAWVRARHRALDAWTLGPMVAESMGVSTKRLGWELLATSGLVTGAVTAACGPLAFLGLATPHLVRMIWKDRSHRGLGWPVAGMGMLLALIGDGLVRWPGGLEEALPLNAVLAMGGAPLVVWLTWKRTWEA
jgi:iron complex transport system permease protein